MKQVFFYPEILSDVNLAEVEKEILDYWKENEIFQKSINNRSNNKKERNSHFVLYDGPPFANGLPHYGHLLTGFIKDVYSRYQTMKGKRVERRLGWDCHGLPAEMHAEKELGISGRLNISNYGIDKFNDHCKSLVMKFTKQWEEYIYRQGRWVDFSKVYKTMDLSFMESVIWAFKELYNKGIVYESMRVMPYSWACETPLSNFETKLDNSYRDRVDKAITCSFILKNPFFRSVVCKYKEYRVLIWTTTPWTLTSNLALAIGKDVEYVLIPKGEVCFILAKFALQKYVNELEAHNIDRYDIILGAELEGLSYFPVFNYFIDHHNAFKILTCDFLKLGEGTGIIHIAPGFGEEDQLLCQKHGIELVCPVDNAGKFTEIISDFYSKNIFKANDLIIEKLKTQGNLVKVEHYKHKYPHCWRSDEPLIYKAVSSWYINVEKIKDKMIELNKEINWVPNHIRDNLFGKWLENAKDWSISRNRFWGTPLPIWKSDNAEYPRIDVYGSIAEIERDFNVQIEDLHRPYIDKLTRMNPNDPTGRSLMKRVEDVFDCWFESGSMPYGQIHYPFENQDYFKDHFPADLVTEYTAQTRGWFYTLIILSTALFNEKPFLNCICHGVVLDTKGQKLSKRLNNYLDPMELFNKYGSDALRVTMLSSNVVKGSEILIDKDAKAVYDTLRLFIKPIWNTYHFFTMYANIDEILASSYLTTDFEVDNLLDKYMLSKLSIIVKKVEDSLDAFDTSVALSTISHFFDVLNNWYIRRSRNRFWKKEKDLDKISAYNTLYTCLEIICKVSAPLIPFVSEKIYLGLTKSNQAGNISIHLCDFPKLEQIEIDSALVEVMDTVILLCSSALSIRNNNNVRIRQPLSSITIVINHLPNEIEKFSDLIKDEVNVKSILWKKNVEDFSTPKLTINLHLLGKRIPNKVKDVIAASKVGSWILLKNNKLFIAEELLNEEEFSLILIPKDNKNSASFLNNKGIIILDLEITEELYHEGIARDLIRLIQEARKTANFCITDRILIEIDIPVSIKENYQPLIEEQTLGKFTNNIATADYTSIVRLNNQNIQLKLKKVNLTST